MPELIIERTIKDRMEIIAPLVKGHRTLDLGVVDSRRGRQGTADRLSDKASDLLFRRICRVNLGTLGIDLDADGVSLLQKEGLHARVADVMTMDLGEQYDVIVAGEIIEHLVNPGQFLCNIRKHLVPEGTLVITTPNPFSCRLVWKIWRYGSPRVHEEHVCWFDPITLRQLCRQSQLEPYAIYWIRSDGRNLLKTWPRWFRKYFSESFMILARPGCS